MDQINRLGTKYIAEAAKAVDAKMLYLSTDYVFGGDGERPWQPDDKCFAPLNVYGQTKLDGEMAVSSITDKYFIVRIARYLVLTAITSLKRCSGSERIMILFVL